MSLSSVNPTLRCLRDWAQVEPAWQRLEAGGRCTAFQTIAWMRPFYRVLAPALGLTPLFLLASVPGSDEPLMLWPLVGRRRAGVPLLAFADAGVSDYNAPLTSAAPLPPALWSDALQTLGRHGALLRLDKLPLEADARPGPWSAANAWLEPESFGAWAVGLPSSAEAFDRQALSPAFAKDLALRRRRLERKGRVSFALAGTPEARRRAFDTLLRQRARRCAETGRNDLLAQPAFRRFYEAAAVEAPGETVRLFTLAVDDTLVATMLAIDHAGVRHMVLPSFEAGEWKNCSPGNVLMLLAIHDAIARGLRSFDFTIGDEAYKSGFGAVRRPLQRAWVPLSPLGAFAAQGIGLARRLRQLGRPLVDGAPAQAGA